MGCVLGCFGGAKDHKDRKQRIKRASSQTRKNRVQNVQQPSTIFAEHAILETFPTNSVSELLIKSEGEEKLSPSPRKRVSCNSNITTYEHVSIHESSDSLPPCNKNVQKEEEDLKGPCLTHSISISEGDSSVTASVGSYPPNHRYQNARDSDDEAEVYGDGELDDLDGLDDEDDYDDDYDEDIDGSIGGDEVWPGSFLTPSMESRTENSLRQVIDKGVDSPSMKTRPLDEEVETLGSQVNARDRSDFVHSVLSTVENTTQWKTAKTKGMHALKPQKENLSANYEAPSLSFSSESICKQAASFNSNSKFDQLKNVNQEIAVDASLSNWLVSHEIIPSNSRKACFSGFESIGSENTMSRGGSTSVRRFEDRPILGALTMEELKQISVSSSPRKSPNQSPDEMPIIGTVGTYWIQSGSTKHLDSASSYKGIPNTTSKYREDKRVNWHSTPFETRLNRALNQGSAEA